LSAARTTWTLVGSGIVALAVAMGIGRFAFTPLLPLMLRDGTLTAAAGAEWAAANYGGYLAGALTASRVFRDPCLGLRIGMAGVALSTLAVAWIDDAGLLGAVLRAAAGVFSAWTLVYASSWYLAELARDTRRTLARGSTPVSAPVSPTPLRLASLGQERRERVAFPRQRYFVRHQEAKVS
jgi:hypothetical protein